MEPRLAGGDTGRDDMVDTKVDNQQRPGKQLKTINFVY